MGEFFSIFEHDTNDTAWQVYSVQEAAKQLGVSESSVRRQLRDLGVARVSGGLICGFVRWTHPDSRKPPIRLCVHSMRAESAV